MAANNSSAGKVPSTGARLPAAPAAPSASRNPASLRLPASFPTPCKVLVR